MSASIQYPPTHIPVFSSQPAYLQRFAMIPRKEFNKQAMYSGTMQATAFNKWLEDLTTNSKDGHIQEYLCFLTVNKGLRFRLISETEFEAKFNTKMFSEKCQ